MRRAAAAGLMGLFIVVFPVSARSDPPTAIIGGLATAVVMTGACTIAVRTADDDVAEDDFARRGWLVGVGGSYAIETFTDDAESNIQNVLGPTMALSVDDSLGINGRAGYRCHPRFSAEVEVEWLDGFEADLSGFGFGQVASIDVEPVVVTANVKGYLLTGRYQPFLLIGAGVMTAKTKVQQGVPLGFPESDRDNEFVMRFGGGIDLYATKHVVVSVEAGYVLPTGSLDDLDYISIGWGFQYRF